MKTITNLVAILTLLISIATFAYVATQRDSAEPTVIGGASPNLSARLLYATTTGIGNHTVVTIAPSREYCSGRAVTATTSLYLSFDPTMTPSSTVARGVYQATGTTMYESEVYGCGAISASANASTTLTVTEFTF